MGIKLQGHGSSMTQYPSGQCALSSQYFAVLGIMSQNIIENFKSCDELLTYLASCEIDQGVKYVHQRGFTQYHQSLEELSCGKFQFCLILWLSDSGRSGIAKWVPVKTKTSRDGLDRDGLDWIDRYHRQLSKK